MSEAVGRGLDDDEGDGGSDETGRGDEAECPSRHAYHAGPVVAIVADRDRPCDGRLQAESADAGGQRGRREREREDSVRAGAEQANRKRRRHQAGERGRPRADQAGAGPESDQLETAPLSASVDLLLPNHYLEERRW